MVISYRSRVVIDCPADAALSRVNGRVTFTAHYLPSLSLSIEATAGPRWPQAAAGGFSPARTAHLHFGIHHSLKPHDASWLLASLTTRSARFTFPVVCYFSTASAVTIIVITAFAAGITRWHYRQYRGAARFRHYRRL